MARNYSDMVRRLGVAGFLFFLINVVMTIGVKGLIGIYSPAKADTRDCVPALQEA